MPLPNDAPFAGDDGGEEKEKFPVGVKLAEDEPAVEPDEWSRALRRGKTSVSYEVSRLRRRGEQLHVAELISAEVRQLERMYACTWSTGLDRGRGHLAAETRLLAELACCTEVAFTASRVLGYTRPAFCLPAPSRADSATPR